MTRYRIVSLSIHQIEETSTLDSLPYFLDLEQVTRDTIKATYNNVAKSIRFNSLIEELPFQNLRLNLSQVLILITIVERVEKIFYLKFCNNNLEE